jgi:hypothetical protein
MSKLPFSNVQYDKLNRAVFPTLRRRDKYGDVGTINTITHGKRGERVELGEAEIIAKEKVTLQELNDQFVQFDTQSVDYKEAMDTINHFYKNPIAQNEELTLYWNRWVNHE